MPRRRSSTVRSRSAAVSACSASRSRRAAVRPRARPPARSAAPRAVRTARRPPARLARLRHGPARRRSGISRRRWRTSSADVRVRHGDRLAGQQPRAVVAAHELAVAGELGERGRDRRAARADELADQPVREHERHGDAVARDAAPALGEMPEQRQQAAVDAVELRDRLRDGEPLRALRQPVDDRPRRSPGSGRARRDAPVDQREPDARERVPADGDGKQLRRALDVPRAAGRRPGPAAPCSPCRRARPRAPARRRRAAGRGARDRRRRAGRRPTRPPGTPRRGRAARAPPPRVARA